MLIRVNQLRNEQKSNQLKYWAHYKGSLFWVQCCQDSAVRFCSESRSLIFLPLRCCRSSWSPTRSREWSTGSSLDCCTCSSSTAEQQQQRDLHRELTGPLFAVNTLKQQTTFIFKSLNIQHSWSSTLYIPRNRTGTARSPWKQLTQRNYDYQSTFWRKSISSPVNLQYHGRTIWYYGILPQYYLCMHLYTLYLYVPCMFLFIYFYLFLKLTETKSMAW